MLVNPIKCFP